MKKLYIETYGCQMNVADSEVVASIMQMAGYELGESVEEADAVFLNTCSVRENAENKIYHRLEALNNLRKRRNGNGNANHSLIIGVLGCMAERVKDDLIQNHHANLVAGPDSYMQLPDDVPEDVKIRRLNEMIALQNELSAISYKADEGKEFEVLVEGYSKRSREQLCGRTSQNKMVVFDKGNHHIGDLVRVRITGSTSATLFGECI